MQFGRSSEKLDTQILQLELMLEDLEEGEAVRSPRAAPHALDQPRRERRQPVRRPLPDHLPREEVVHHPGSVCPGCGGTRFSQLGEDVTAPGGRPPKLTDDDIEAARAMLANPDIGVTQIAHRLGVSPATLRSIAISPPRE